MKNYHSFSSTEFIDDPKIEDVIGIRGMRVMELASLGAPILPGFIMPNETMGEIAGNASEMKKFIIEPMVKIERLLKKKFNDERNPLLIKVVESPMLNMIQAFSIHNIGLCDKTVGGFATFVGEEFAYHEYRNVIRKIIELELKIGVDKEREKKAVYANRRRVRGPRGKRLLRGRGEIVERGFQHVLDGGGMRRTWLRGRANVEKRYRIAVAAHNLSLILRGIVGAGKPREMVARFLQLVFAVLSRGQRFLNRWVETVLRNAVAL